MISAALIFYILTIAGLFRLRVKLPNLERPYRAIGYPVIPALYILGAAVILVILFTYQTATTWPGLAIILAGVPAYLLNSTLIGVMAQRLVRTLCRHCKTPDGGIADEVWNDLIRPFKAPRPTHVYRPVGCLECRMTGYRGRTGLYEILVSDERSRQILTDQPDLLALRRHAMKAGMRPLRLAGAMRVASGLTTVDEVIRNTPPIES